MSIKKGVQTLAWHCLFLCSSTSIVAGEQAIEMHAAAHFLDANEDIASLDFDDFVPRISDMSARRDSIVFKNVARSGFHEQCKAIAYSVYAACIVVHQWMVRNMSNAKTHKLRS